jgi:hypothetical protein
MKVAGSGVLVSWPAFAAFRQAAHMVLGQRELCECLARNDELVLLIEVDQEARAILDAVEGEKLSPGDQARGLRDKGWDTTALSGESEEGGHDEA